MTEILDANDAHDLARAADLLRAGRLVAVPTETVYGLAADARQPDAVRAIFAAKNRPADHPLIVHVGDAAQLEEWAVRIPPAAFTLIERFWPGPLTLVLHKAPGVDPVVTGGHATVALRMPAHPALLALLRSSGLAVAAPSANPHKRLSPTSAAHVLDAMAGRLAAVLDGGECRVGIESTILDLTGEQPQVLRAGPITASAIAEQLGCPVATPSQHSVAVPGNMPEHYQPRTPVRLKTAQEISQAADFPVARILLSLDADQASVTGSLTRQMPRDKPAYARLLYRALHEADQLEVREIWVESPPATEEWADVIDRLLRASAGAPRTTPGNAP